MNKKQNGLAREYWETAKLLLNSDVRIAIPVLYRAIRNTCREIREEQLYSQMVKCPANSDLERKTGEE